MKVLVVHDRNEIANEISDLLVELGIQSDHITRAFDGVGARESLQHELYDLVILDLTLPHMRGKYPPNYQTAEELLTELFEGALTNTPGDLIGITKEASALEAIDSKVGPHLMAIVEEDGRGVWKTRLADRVKYVLKAAGSRLQSINRYYDYDVAIITALDKEFKPFIESFDLQEIAHFDGAKSFLFNDRLGSVRRGIAYAIGKPGQASAASATQALITQFRPSLCLMSGFCGGFSTKVNLGHVLLAESVFDWDTGKWKGAGEASVFVPRPDPISIRDSKAHRIVRDLVQSRLANEADVIDRLKELSQSRLSKIELKLGPIASGSAVVTDRSIMDRIQNLNENILGVDMEAFGFYYASSMTPVIKPEFLLVKSVADFCDLDKDDKDQEACSYLSAKVIEEIVCRRWLF